MGTVYRARHRQTGQCVAVKQMLAEAATNPQLVKRFQQEFAASSRLCHPHLVQAVDFGVKAGQPYMVMEFVEGESLGKRIARQGPLPREGALHLIAQIAEGLQLAHEHRLVHRDVKPDNILLTKDGRAKLTDLGLVKDLNASVNLTWARASLGTIVYAAPEQFEDARAVDVRCDVYGLGASLYHALAGVAPFQGRNALVLLQQKLKNRFKPPSAYVPTLPRHIDAAICQALDALPARRQSSCAEFAASLFATSLADGVPTAASEVGFMPCPAERRGAIRFPTALEVVCCPQLDASKQVQGVIKDISLTGIRLTLHRPFEPGMTLFLGLSDDQLPAASSLCAEVRWLRQLTVRKWESGCALNPVLSQSELKTLLGNLPTTVLDCRDEDAHRR